MLYEAFSIDDLKQTIAILFYYSSKWYIWYAKYEPAAYQIFGSLSALSGSGSRELSYDMVFRVKINAIRKTCWVRG